MSTHKELNCEYTYCLKHVDAIKNKGHEVRRNWTGTNCPTCRKYMTNKNPAREADKALRKFLVKEEELRLIALKVTGRLEGKKRKNTIIDAKRIKAAVRKEIWDSKGIIHMPQRKRPLTVCQARLRDDMVLSRNFREVTCPECRVEYKRRYV